LSESLTDADPDRPRAEPRPRDRGRTSLFRTPVTAFEVTASLVRTSWRGRTVQTVPWAISGPWRYRAFGDIGAWAILAMHGCSTARECSCTWERSGQWGSTSRLCAPGFVQSAMGRGRQAVGSEGAGIAEVQQHRRVAHDGKDRLAQASGHVRVDALSTKSAAARAGRRRNGQSRTRPGVRETGQG
jgi:hypothetical protein